MLVFDPANEGPIALATAAADPTISPFDRLGGMPVMRRITERFYDLMETESGYAALRARHAPDLTAMRASLPLFLAGWAGGPRDWWNANPGKCMMSMHAPFTIDTITARQWAEAMRRAIADARPPDQQIAAALAGVLEQMALGMARA